MNEDFFITCNHENHWIIDDEHRDAETIINLKDEYQKYWQKIVAGENFALVRYADGERSLMLGKAVKAQEGWQAGQGLTLLGEDLKKALGFADKNFVYGISCPCCDSAAYYWYMSHLEGCTVTFSNIWANINFANFFKDFQKLERDAVLITNFRGKGKPYGKLRVKKHYCVDDDCVNFWARQGQQFIQQIISETGHEKNLLYAVSAGPTSELIIKALYENNPDNCYIDFGSALDVFTHSKITRPYVIENNAYAQQNCWMFDSTKINFDVDVVLSAYKRPEVLAQQLDAIKNQTLRPRRIFLYQDAVKPGEQKIVIDEKILEQFDGYKIAETNGGVWKRFEYAAKKTLSPYVCIFDDDTIPGSRWLENCHMHMVQRTKGVYGTNGIILTDLEGYPNIAFRVGWHCPNEEALEVDFVGHSWFVQREYLNWMLAKNYKERYKYVGEDMCLSYFCAEHGVETYVPIHPEKIQSLWGSIPEYYSKYKKAGPSVAVSENPINIKAMKDVLREIHADGWRFLFERNPRYVAYVSDLMKKFFEPTLSPKEYLTKNTAVILKNFGKRPPAFMGEKKYLPFALNIFSISKTDYSVLEDEENMIKMSRLQEVMRTYALNIIFTDIYPQIKNILEQSGLKEYEDFIDGRYFLLLNSMQGQP